MQTYIVWLYCVCLYVSPYFDSESRTPRNEAMNGLLNRTTLSLNRPYTTHTISLAMLARILLLINLC